MLKGLANQMETGAHPFQFRDNARQLRVETLSKLRWLALFGQLATVLATCQVLRFPLPLALCLVVIGVSALLNIAFRLLAPKILRLAVWPATALLAFDVLQLTALLYLTGGLENPFSVLFLAPVTIAAVSLPPRQIVLIAVLTALAASLLGVEHQPLPWYGGQPIHLPWLYQVGMWFALLVACVFIAAYASRVAGEARALSEALTAAELVLERQNHLSQLDGLAAAAAHELGTPLATIALVTKELSNGSLPSEFSEDLLLLAQQAQRCRDILGRLTSLANDDEKTFYETRLSILLEQVVAPHRQDPIKIAIDAKGEGNEPSLPHSPAIMYGIGNFVENAIDFARTAVTIEARWTPSLVTIVILDDGPGFSLDVFDRIGDPYITSRAHRRRKADEGSGLGLGVFIAKTLLERTGAEIKFSNREMAGASVALEWSRSRIESVNE
jgi:two-component system, sensor histidine kinase RegB